MTVLLKTLQVILALSLLVFIHELGHYFFAKLFRITGVFLPITR